MALRISQMGREHQELRKVSIALLQEKGKLRRSDVTGRIARRHYPPNGGDYWDREHILSDERSRLRLMENNVLHQLCAEGFCTPPVLHRPKTRPDTGSGEWQTWHLIGRMPLPGTFESVKSVLATIPPRKTRKKY